MTIPNTIIEAGAGTGKTYQIMQLLCQGLKSGQFDIDNVAVITFTRKAAAELKERVMEMLQKEAGTNPRLNEQLINLGNAHISTIHSFCESLLKALPVEAGIDPSFQIIEEENEKSFFSKVFNEWVIDKLENQPQELKLLCLDNQIPIYPNENNPYQRPGTDKSLSGILKSVLKYRELKLFEPGAPTQTLPEIIAAFEKNAKKLISEITESDNLVDLLNSILINFLSLSQDSLSQYAADLNHVKFRPGNTGGGANKDLKTEWIETCEQFVNDAKFVACFPEVLQLHKAFNVVATDFCQYYRDTMHLTGVMDFTEILIKTEELLRTHSTAREYFKSKFKFLFVDEFQDTDPIQAHIVFFLAEKTGEFAARWEDVNLAKNKLCVVGDPKQSIYRFRRADIEIYSAVADKISKSGERKVLAHSFRSGEKILEWVNEFFVKSLVKPADGNWQVDYQAISIAPKADRIKGNAPNRDLDNKGDVIFVQSASPVPGPKGKWGADFARETEAKVTAKWIKDNATKYGGFQNVLVLFRKYKNMQQTSDMLEKLGVPSEVVGGKSFFGRQEVIDLDLFLRAVTDPLDSVSILATLRGPFFCFTDAQLCEWKLKDSENHRFAYHGKISEKFDPDHVVSKALMELNKLFLEADKISAHELLKRELTERKLLVSYRGSQNGSRTIMNIVKALELLKEFENLPARLAVKEFSQKIETNAQMGDFSPHTGKNEAVQLMTIYKAKGLQNRVVYLADTTSTPSGSNNTYIDHSNNELLYSLGGALINETKLRIPEIEYLDNLDKFKITAEEDRVRYVAGTRAIEALVINHRPVVLSKDDAKTIFRPLEIDCQDPVEVDISGINLSYYIPPPSTPVKEDYKAQWVQQQQTIENSVQDVSQPSMKIISPSHAELSEDASTEVTVKVMYDPADYSYRIEPQNAAQLGIMVHKLLELQPADVEEAAKTLIHEAGVKLKPEALIERYQKVQERTEKLCKDAKNILREVPIKYCDDAGNFYDGIIDLLIETDSGWTVIDYKILSADYTEADLEEKYKAQMNVYTEGLKKLGLTVGEPVLLTS